MNGAATSLRFRNNATEDDMPTPNESAPKQEWPNADPLRDEWLSDKQHAMLIPDDEGRPLAIVLQTVSRAVGTLRTGQSYPVIELLAHPDYPNGYSASVHYRTTRKGCPVERNAMLFPGEYALNREAYARLTVSELKHTGNAGSVTSTGRVWKANRPPPERVPKAKARAVDILPDTPL